MDQIHQTQSIVLKGLKYHSLQKANVTADRSENHFTPENPCDQNNEQWIEAVSRFETVANNTS
jgi:hypothetical protein